MATTLEGVKNLIEIHLANRLGFDQVLLSQDLTTLCVRVDMFKDNFKITEKDAIEEILVQSKNFLANSPLVLEYKEQSERKIKKLEDTIEDLNAQINRLRQFESFYNLSRNLQEGSK